MKNWLAAVGRFLSSFVLVLTLLLCISVLGESAGGRDFAEILTAIIGETARLLPLAATAAIFLGAQSFKRKGRLGIIGLASLLLFGFALLSGGFSLRRFSSIEAGTAREMKAPATGVIQEVKDGAVYIGGHVGGQARTVLAFKAQGEAAPRLTYAEEAGYSAATASLDLGGSRFGIGEQTRDTIGFAGRFPDLEGRFLNRPLAAIDARSIPEAAIVLAAFSLLAACLAGLGTLARWSLVGLFMSGAGFVALLAVDGALASPMVRDFLGNFAPKVGLALPSFELVTAGIEGFLALVVGTMVLAARPKESE